MICHVSGKEITGKGFNTALTFCDSLLQESWYVINVPDMNPPIVTKMAIQSKPRVSMLHNDASEPYSNTEVKHNKWNTFIDTDF